MGLLARLKATGYRKEDGLRPKPTESVAETGKKRRSYTTSSNFKTTNPARDFYIEQEAPHKIWKPNEYICGEAVLVLKNDIENIAVMLSLLGEVKTRGLGPRTRSEKLFERTTVVYGEPEEAEPGKKAVINGLTKGEHRFPFRLKVPSKNIFTSIKFERGSISYCIRCTLEASQNRCVDKVMAVCERNISVMVPLDVSNVPKPKTKTVVLQSPAVLKQTKTEHDSSSSFTKRTGGSKNSGSTIATSNSFKTVTINVDLPSSGYVIGEVIPVKLNLEHYREYSHSTGLIATLVRICRVEDSSKENAIETYRKDICQTVSPIYVNPESLECSVTVYLKVPFDAFPTLRLPNRRFSFQYYVEVLVNLSRKNLAFTESNRVVDTTSNAQVSSSPGKSIEETLAILQRKIQSGSSTENFQDDDRESMIFFKDLINVDKLKRLRNVTGMSIEIVVGTTRLEPSNTGTAAETPAENALSPNNTTAEISLADATVSTTPHTEVAPTDYVYSRSEKHTLLPRPSYVFDYEESPLLPLPEYTPNSLFNVTEDKDEIELKRLEELESEPPMAA
ncbi:LANO_0D08020g1_1 [Lachancea nothofagi CBS 11611]|uniref:pH-response regulator protein palF/RIM8 n=1 Tax=Lachancea nothofagi CBS 11611 TaxID=1266666 RepID=A0A1G4JIR9_9SACH|nr:LANO_0D08020g1_1 [Lachancea nothofagi CBS 11611]